MINSQTARIKFKFNMNWQMGIDPKKIFKRALNWQLLLKIFENSPYKEFIDQGNGSKRVCNYVYCVSIVKCFVLYK